MAASPTQGTVPELPHRDALTIHFAHVAYRLAERFAARDTGIAHFQTWNEADTLARAGEADVVVTSGLWRPALAEPKRLAYVHVCAAGFDNFDLDALRQRGTWMANSTGVNRNAVSDHAMALILSISRRLYEARDHQQARHWRGMVSDFGGREDELAGKTLLVFGLGGIGERLARLARAFDMRVIGFKRNAVKHEGNAHEVHPSANFHAHLPSADYVALCCPLTDETRQLVNGDALSAMRSSAWLVNVARGGCVDTEALVDALQQQRIAGAALDVTEPEPLPAESPLWAMPNVIVTPHTGGETHRYEDNVLDILLENLERHWNQSLPMRNQILGD